MLQEGERERVDGKMGGKEDKRVADVRNPRLKDWTNSHRFLFFEDI